MYGIIYEAISPVGKIYIGQTTKTLEGRIKSHASDIKSSKRKTMFQLAILEYGIESFIWEQIDTAESKVELDEKERYWINKSKSMEPSLGYNNKEGGIGTKYSLKARKNMSEAQKGKILPIEQRVKISESLKKSNHPLHGGHHTPESRKKMSEVRTGMKLSRPNHAKLTEDDVRDIKLALANGKRSVEIAKIYNLKSATIRAIKCGKNWSHVTIIKEAL